MNGAGVNPSQRAFVLAAAAAVLGGCGLLGPSPLVAPAIENALPDTPRNLPTHADSGISMLALLEPDRPRVRSRRGLLYRLLTTPRLTGCTGGPILTGPAPRAGFV